MLSNTFLSKRLRGSKDKSLWRDDEVWLWKKDIFVMKRRQRQQNMGWEGWFLLTTAILNYLNLITVQYVCEHRCACVSPNLVLATANVVSSSLPTVQENARVELRCRMDLRNGTVEEAAWWKGWGFLQGRSRDFRTGNSQNSHGNWSWHPHFWCFLLCLLWMWLPRASWNQQWPPLSEYSLPPPLSLECLQSLPAHFTYTATPKGLFLIS